MKNSKLLTSLLIICFLCTIISILFYVNQHKITNTLIEKEVFKIREENLNLSKGLEPNYSIDEVELVTIESFIKHKNEFKKAKPKSRIEIPSIDLSLPIFAGINQTHLLMGAGEQIKNMEVGEYGNYILAAHRMPYTSGLGFNRIEKMEPGDLIYIHKDNVEYIYETNLVREVSESDVKYLEDSSNEKLLTLYTCKDISVNSGNTNKIVVQAKLVE